MIAITTAQNAMNFMPAISSKMFTGPTLSFRVERFFARERKIPLSLYKEKELSLTLRTYGFWICKSLLRTP
jgi:hypothetical protein